MSGKIQNADIKSETELIGLGATKAQLPNDDKIYIKALKDVLNIDKTLNEAFKEMLFDSEQPLRIFLNLPNDSRINFKSSEVLGTDGLTKVMSPIQSVLSIIPNVYVDFQSLTRVSNTTYFNYVWPSIGNVGDFCVAAFTLIVGNKIKITFSDLEANLLDLPETGSLFDSSGIPLGYARLECTDAVNFYFKSIGAATNTISHGEVYKFGVGGGSGGSVTATNSSIEVINNTEIAVKLQNDSLLGETLSIENGLTLNVIKTFTNADVNTAYLRNIAYVFNDTEFALADKNNTQLDNFVVCMVLQQSAPAQLCKLLIKNSTLVKGFTGLVTGKTYYINTNGTIDLFTNISWVAGDSVVSVGKAISTTELIFDAKFEYEYQ